jgi:AraC-like DNA-binding protein
LGDSSAILGKSARRLWNQLGESSSFEGRVEIAEHFLISYASRARTLGTIAAVADYVFRQHGAVNVTTLANQGFTSVRQFERQFRQEIGASPKVFARIARFQAALDAKVAAPNRSQLRLLRPDAHDPRL